MVLDPRVCRHGGVIECGRIEPKLAFAVVLRIQSCVEQLRKMVQSGSHGGQLLLSFCGDAAVMATSKTGGNENKTLEKAAMVWLLELLVD